MTIIQEGEPMSDLISRQAAIDAIGKTSDELYENIKKGATFPQRQWFDGMAQAQSILENLPSAQQEQPHWIPCSERMPHGSCSDLVNVSIHDDSGDTPFDYTSCGWVTTDGEYWIVDNEINNHVIAWMQLPKPYGGESDEM